MQQKTLEDELQLRAWAVQAAKERLASAEALLDAQRKEHIQAMLANENLELQLREASGSVQPAHQLTQLGSMQSSRAYLQLSGREQPDRNPNLHRFDATTAFGDPENYSVEMQLEELELELVQRELLALTSELASARDADVRSIKDLPSHHVEFEVEAEARALFTEEVGTAEMEAEACSLQSQEAAVSSDVLALEREAKIAEARQAELSKQLCSARDERSLLQHDELQLIPGRQGDVDIALRFALERRADRSREVAKMMREEISLRRSLERTQSCAVRRSLIYDSPEPASEP